VSNTVYGRAPAVPELDTLAKFSLFRGLTTEQLAKFREFLQCKRSPARAEIITAKHPGEIVYIILDGTVKVYVGRPDGTEVILAILGTDEIVGDMSLVDSFERSASVVTLEPCTFLVMSRADFWTSLREMPTVACNLINILSRRLRLSNARAESLAALDIHGRVAAQLLAFAKEYGEATPNGDVLIPLRITQSDLASIIGASRVRVNQALNFYKQRNYLSVNRANQIAIRNPEALSRRCS
jgi:CRP/FNR family transcriptional regulator, cyclic AMP receptor protein